MELGTAWRAVLQCTETRCTEEDPTNLVPFVAVHVLDQDRPALNTKVEKSRAAGLIHIAWWGDMDRWGVPASWLFFLFESGAHQPSTGLLWFARPVTCDSPDR